MRRTQEGRELRFFHFEYQEGLGFLKIKAECKAGAIKIVRCLMGDPENWVMTQITESRDCHIPITPNPEQRRPE